MREVCLWADRYIPFEKLSADQLAARTELRHRLASLSAEPGEILHASYLGPKRSDMDLENLLLYNIGGSCFRPSASHGIRFELARRAVRVPPSGQTYKYCYRYRAAPSEEPSASWISAQLLASFVDVELDSFSVERVTQTWFAVRRCADVVISDRTDASQVLFSVLLRLRHPPGANVWPSPDLTKPLIDGVIAAFQAHTDPTTVGEAASRIGRKIGQDVRLTARLLTGAENAVLGDVPRLVHLRGNGIIWNPADHRCALGELLVEEGNKHEWRLSGELHAVQPRL